jgi:hypothetical protein
VNIRKITLEDNEVLKKYRVQTRNYHVSGLVEEFTCGSHAMWMHDCGADDAIFGVSKQAYHVSTRAMVSRFLGSVSDGT